MDPFNVLDHGFIKLIESWGSDEQIVASARMSTDGAFRGWGPHHKIGCAWLVRQGPCDCGMPIAGDERLLRYLWEHKHASPFEFAGCVVEVQAPIFVFREWHRHRSQCLAGDTSITCISPNGTPYQRTIKEIYDLKYGGVIDDFSGTTKNGYSKAGTPVIRKRRLKNSTRTRILPNCQARLLRVLDEITNTLTTSPMQDVYKSGVKRLFTLHTSAGDIRASASHPFYSNNGWKQLNQLQPDDLIAIQGKVSLTPRPIPPALRAGIGVWTSMMRGRLILPIDQCYECGDLLESKYLELDHIIPVYKNLSLALTESNLKPICKPCHRGKINLEQPSRGGKTGLGVRWAVVISVEKDTIEETYDISVAGPHHNFIANGFVVHNSYNELSARYTELPDLFYIPSVERLMAGKQSAKNKQGSEEGFTETQAKSIQDELAYVSDLCRKHYEGLLAGGLSRELARLVIPTNQYSRMRASGNLRNMLAFLTLRLDPAAQYEIRAYAEALSDILATTFPKTHALFKEEFDAQRS